VIRHDVYGWGWGSKFFGWGWGSEGEWGWDLSVGYY